MRRLVLVLLVTACEPALPEGWGQRDAGYVSDAGVDAGRKYVTFTPDGGGWAVTVDAMDSTRWASVDLDAPAEVPFEGNGWDLAFSRFHIRARGGASGDGGVAITAIYDAGYALVQQSPNGPWLQDLPDGPDENMDLDTVLDKAEVWYDYEGVFHSLTPRPIVYVVRTDRAGYFKLKIDGYYDRAGTPAFFRLRFAPIAAP